MLDHLCTPAPLLGVELTPEAIRMIMLRRRCGQFQCMFAWQQPLADIPQTSSSAHSYWMAVGSALSQLVATHQLRDTATALSLPLRLVRTHNFVFPSILSDEAVQAEIYAHFCAEMPWQPDELRMDFVASAATREEMSVHVVATRLKHLTPYLQCIRTAGLRVIAVDVDMYALMRVVRFCLAPRPDDGAITVLYAHHQQLAMLSFDDQRVLFQRQCEFTHATQLDSVLMAYTQHRAQHATAYSDNDVILCVEETSLAIVQAALAAATLCGYVVNPFLRMSAAKGMRLPDATLMRDGLVACGLAMRQVPKWYR